MSGREFPDYAALARCADFADLFPSRPDRCSSLDSADADVATATEVPKYIVMALYSHGLCSYGPI